MRPQLCKKAKEIAEHLAILNFKASNGWLDTCRRRKRYNVKKMMISEEAGDVRRKTDDSQKERLPELLQGYSSCDIWNLAETAGFHKVLPDGGYGRKNHSAWRQKGKQQVTIALLANADGEKEDAIVICKSENPTCFKGINKTQLPVQCFNQVNGWMTGEISRILSKLNRRLRSTGRSVMLLMDNAGCRPTGLKDEDIYQY